MKTAKCIDPGFLTSQITVSTDFVLKEFGLNDGSVIPTPSFPISSNPLLQVLQSHDHAPYESQLTDILLQMTIFD